MLPVVRNGNVVGGHADGRALTQTGGGSAVALGRSAPLARGMALA